MTEPNIINAIKDITAKLKWAHISIIPPNWSQHIFCSLFYNSHLDYCII